MAKNLFKNTETFVESTLKKYRILINAYSPILSIGTEEKERKGENKWGIPKLIWYLET